VDKHKAKIACSISGRDVYHDFVDDNKIVEIGITSRKIQDYELSRYASAILTRSGVLQR
jgi:hypothetical protein